MATMSGSFLKKPVFPESLYKKNREEKKIDPYVFCPNLQRIDNEKNFGFSVKDSVRYDAGFVKKYRVSDRLLELAQPRVRSLIKDDLKKKLPNVNSVVVFETSRRIIQLAKPKKVQPPSNKSVQRIPSRVLKAKATKRTIQLSMPRHNNKIMKSKDKVSSARRFRQFDKKKKKSASKDHKTVWKNIDADKKKNTKKFGSTPATLKSNTMDIKRDTRVGCIAKKI